MFYTIPESLAAEINDLESKIEQFQAGRLEAAALKVHRVPFGVYEQRQDNTFMVRVRCPGGALTPGQLRTLARLSQEYGADVLHITTRQEFQIHDVPLDRVVPIMRRLLPAGLSSRGGGGNTVRNITASIEAGVDPDEVFDVSPYAFALTSRLVAEPDSWRLPRKYKIAFSHSPKDTARAAFNDLGFIARMREGQRGFEVYVAGGMGTKPQAGHRLHDFVPETEVYFIATAIKRMFDKYGNRKNRYAARLRFLWGSLGEARFRELYEEERAALRRENAAPLVLPTLRSAVPAPSLVAQRDDSAEFAQWRRRFVTPQKQPGLYSILVPVFLGNLSLEGAFTLADFLEGFGDDVLRATIDQNLCLRHIPEAFLGNAWAVLKLLAPLASEPRFVGTAVACTGASTCKLGICLPRGALAAALDKLRASDLDLDRLADLRMNLSGCPNTCGAHMAADLGFFGKVLRQGQTPYPAYGIVVGGRLGNGEARMAEPVGDVGARDLPEFVAGFLRHYLAAQPACASFTEYLDKLGKPFIRSWCQAHREVPKFEEDASYYYDWSAQEVFSMAGRGSGECSAGLFDMIDFDLNRLRDLKSDLAEARGAQRADVLFKMTLSAARMLLVTRSLEPHSEKEIFSQFRRHFIEAGLVDRKFLPLVDAALNQDLPGIGAREGDVLSLAQTMEELYRSMDNSLRFPAEARRA